MNLFELHIDGLFALCAVWRENSCYNIIQRHMLHWDSSEESKVEQR